jgi:hypothetical protein
MWVLRRMGLLANAHSVTVQTKMDEIATLARTLTRSDVQTKMDEISAARPIQ